MRRAASMTPEELRAAGVYLNAGRRRGWKRRLALLLDTPEATISAWATRSPGNARPIPGVAAVSVRLLTALLRQEAAARGDLVAAARVLADQVAGLALRSEALAAAAPAAAPRLEPTPPERPPLAVPQLAVGGDRRILRHAHRAKAPARPAPGPQPPSPATPAVEGAPLRVLPRGGRFENRPQ